MTASNTQNARFGCPHCNSDRISENDIVGVRLRVIEWNEDGEPASFAYPWQIKDDTITIDEENPRYYCNECEKEFEEVVNLNESPTRETARGDSG